MKKSPKFTCNVCGVKQALKKVFAKSHKAADCRKLVQSYNAAQGEYADAALEDNVHIQHGTSHSQQHDELPSGSHRPSKWQKFIEQRQHGTTEKTHTHKEEEIIDKDDDVWTIPAPASRPIPAQYTSKKRAAAEKDSFLQSNSMPKKQFKEDTFNRNGVQSIPGVMHSDCEQTQTFLNTINSNEKGSLKDNKTIRRKHSSDDGGGDIKEQFRIERMSTTGGQLVAVDSKGKWSLYLDDDGY